MAHTRQSKPNSGLGVQVKVHKTFPSSFGSGPSKRSSGCSASRTHEKKAAAAGGAVPPARQKSQAIPQSLKPLVMLMDESHKPWDGGIA